MDEVRNTGVSDGEPTNSVYVAAMNQGCEMEDWLQAEEEILAEEEPKNRQ